MNEVGFAAGERTRGDAILHALYLHRFAREKPMDLATHALRAEPHVEIGTLLQRDAALIVDPGDED